MPFDHPEGFCLMSYAGEDGHTKELLWNSRDGVTPFVIRSRDGADLSHVGFSDDLTVPGYLPAVGSRVFVDATLDDFLKGVRKRFEGYLDRDGTVTGDLAIRFPGQSIDQIVDAIAGREFGQHEGQPHVEIVTPSMLEEFKKTAGERIAEATEKGWRPEVKA
jgi:hypothetical protein